MTDNNDTNQVDGSAKLRNDLDAVMEKVQLCREIMLESPGIEEDETLAGVIGFLEACRDRLNELIEAGTQGQLSEELFERCFIVNDAVSKTLEAERTGTKISVQDGLEGSSKEKTSNNENLLDLGGEQDKEDEDKELTVRKAGSSISSQKDVSFSKPKAQQQPDDSLLAPYVAPTPTGTAAPSSTAVAEEDPFGADFDTKPIDLPVPPSPTPWDNTTSIPATTTESVVPSAASASVTNASENNNLAGLTTNLAATSVSPPTAPVPTSSITDTTTTTTTTTGIASSEPVSKPAGSINHAADASAEFDAFLDSLDQPAKKEA